MLGPANNRREPLSNAPRLPNGGIYAVYPPGRQVAPATREFVELYRK
jgi:hypothetical protein